MHCLPSLVTTCARSAKFFLAISRLVSLSIPRNASLVARCSARIAANVSLASSNTSPPGTPTHRSIASMSARGVARNASSISLNASFPPRRAANFSPKRLCARPVDPNSPNDVPDSVVPRLAPSIATRASRAPSKSSRPNIASPLPSSRTHAAVRASASRASRAVVARRGVAASRYLRRPRERSPARTSSHWACRPPFHRRARRRARRACPRFRPTASASSRASQRLIRLPRPTRDTTARVAVVVVVLVVVVAAIPVGASSNESKSVEKDKSALDRHIATRGSRVPRADDVASVDRGKKTRRYRDAVRG